MGKETRKVISGGKSARKVIENRPLNGNINQWKATAFEKDSEMAHASKDGFKCVFVWRHLVKVYPGIF